jgi:hypothetical protein
MPTVTYTNSSPGTIVNCFLLTNLLPTWSTGKVLLTEVSPGVWTGTLSAGDWGVFEGNSQPVSFEESVGTFLITEEPTPTVTPPGTLAGQLKEINDLLGPKRIKTPNMETEDHDLKDLLAVQRTTTVVRPHFSNFAFTKVKPKGGCSCEDSVSQSDCNRNY